MTSNVVTRPAKGRASALAKLEAGEAAVGAGVLEAGLQCLRRTIAEADVGGNPTLRACARVALGSALVHAARGRDAEGAAALHEALTIGADAAPECVAAARGDAGGATNVLLDILERCRRLPDSYLWGSAYVLDVLCKLAILHGNDRATEWVFQLMTISSRAGMRELLARCHCHRGRLGETGAADASRLLATYIANPVLSAFVT